jgi:PLP dependent protein
VAADIRSNLAVVRERIAAACLRCGRSPAEITLIAVTKTVAPQIIEEAFRLGVRDFAENRVQEAESKADFFKALSPSPVLHMIGHLQSNKVKTALGFFNMFHSLDSLKLADILDRQAGGLIPVLLEVNVAGEASKTGFSLEEIGPALKGFAQFKNLQVRGLMTVAPIVDNLEQVRPVFRKLREIRDAYYLEHLSMGMTDDFETAIEEGATLIRLGRAIFGERV